MNLTNIAHAGLALAFQIVTGLIAWVLGAEPFAASVMGGLFAVGFYLGREVTQAERKAGTPPWWSGFDMTKWSQDAVYDLVLPAAACLIVCVVTFFFE